jgi:galactose oxidase
MNGSAVMYDAGKILAVGGAPDYTDSVATDHANLIDITGPTPVVTKLPPMHSARAYGYAIALPDGTVLVSGGQAYAKTYTDATAAMRPELFDPSTSTFTELAPMSVPRTYHSFAVLLPDARVLVGGGGLCDGCGHDHADVEVFTPPYLAGREATRPRITRAPTAAAAGSTITVSTDRAVSSFSLVRMGTATHSVDTDQRRIALTPVTNADGTTSLTLPADHGVVPPGPWMLFAMDAQGVPSVAATMLLS